VVVLSPPGGNIVVLTEDVAFLATSVFAAVGAAELVQAARTRAMTTSIKARNLTVLMVP